MTVTDEVGTRPRGELLAVGDERWRHALAHLDHDFYHLPRYVEFEARRQGGEAAAVLVRGHGALALLPLVIRPLPADLAVGEARDATSPYGYPGPLLGGPGRPEDVVPAMVATLHRAGLCAAFIRLHPLLTLPESVLAEHGTVADHGPTVWIDLTRGEDEIWAGMRKTTRNLVRRTEREGFEAFVDEHWHHLDDFARLYGATMQRVGADASYDFTVDELAELRAALEGDLHLCVVVRDGEVAAAGLFAETCRTVEYHLAGSAAVPGQASPNRLMLHSMIGWAKRRGNLRFHLGGGLAAEEDSLFRFKAGFSPQRARFRTWRLVLDTDAYSAAVRARRGADRDAGDESRFFPAYRAPRAGY